MEVTRYFTKGAECVSLKYSQLMSYNILTTYNKHKQQDRQIVLSYMLHDKKSTDFANSGIYNLHTVATLIADMTQ